MTTKLKLLFICYWINILMIVFFAIITIAAIFRQQAFLSYVFFDETFVNIKMIFTIRFLFYGFMI